MKAFLMYKDQDFQPQPRLPVNEKELIQDLELNTLFNSMAKGDEFLFAAAKNAILLSLHEPETIYYRQHILQDCLQNAEVVRDLYDLSVEAIINEKKHYWGFASQYPDSILRRSIEVLQMFVGIFIKLRSIVDKHKDTFESDGFKRLFAMVQEEIGDEYVATVQTHLKTLKFKNGILVSAGLGKGNKGINYILHRPELFDQKIGWLKRILTRNTPSAYTFYINERDESGYRALSKLRNQGINLVANAVAQSNDHIVSFFTMLRLELAFYVGCINLYEQLVSQGKVLSFPLPVEQSERIHSCKGLYDVCLALTSTKDIIGNDLQGDHNGLVIITGANQGGKSTFLRSIGLSQLMMQCGMFVPAEYFSANLCRGLFTHYRREEDATMNSGKLEEELSRMNDIVENLLPNAMILFNESFATTYENEGSEIARQIVCALFEKRIKIFFVTHLYEFAHRLYAANMENTLFLRAKRQADGGRTFKLIEGEPLKTSYGEDLYNILFETKP